MKKQNTKKLTHFVIPCRKLIEKAHGSSNGCATCCYCRCIGSSAPQE